MPTYTVWVYLSADRQELSSAAALPFPPAAARGALLSSPDYQANEKRQQRHGAHHWLSRLPRLAGSGDREGPHRRTFLWWKYRESRGNSDGNEGNISSYSWFGFRKTDQNLANVPCQLEVFGSSSDVVTRLHRIDGKLTLAAVLTLLDRLIISAELRRPTSGFLRLVLVFSIM